MRQDTTTRRRSYLPAKKYCPRAAEVPFFALFEVSMFSSHVGRLGQSMRKVAPLGKRALKGRFARTRANGAPLSRKTFLQEISPLAAGFVLRTSPSLTLGRNDRWGEVATPCRPAEVSGFASGYAVTSPLSLVAPLGNRLLIRAACGGGAIFNIVGFNNMHVGNLIQANNVEGGSSREESSESRVHSNARKRRRFNTMGA